MNAINRKKGSAKKPVAKPAQAAKLTPAQTKIVLDFLPYALAHQRQLVASANSAKAIAVEAAKAKFHERIQMRVRCQSIHYRCR